ncbi:MAG: acyl-CoA dehydrogenase [Myxococcales bacterium]|nr:acyl-CoA dehydrogenase [Myxococcales bacterium]
MSQPFLSTTDLAMFFADHHDGITNDLLSFATHWSPRDYSDDWLATRDAVSQLANHQINSLCIPERYKGRAVNNPVDIDARAITLARECLGYLDGLLDCAFAMQGLGSYPISMAGTEDQKMRYLPGFLSGERIGAFALTEPKAGSDVGSLKMKAKKDKNGDYLLSGQKTFISNAGVATQYIVFASTQPKKKSRGISAFIVEPGDNGIKIDPFEVMAPHPIGTITLRKTRIPATRRLGEEGDGFKIAMQTLNTFRLSVAGAALGMARRALDEATKHAMERQQFGGALFEQQQVAAMLADSATELDAARLLVYRAAYLRDMRDIFGNSAAKEVAMAKLYATEAASRIIDRCVQIHGGIGVKKGSVPERLYREVRALRIYEGASEIQKVVIARQIQKDYEFVKSLEEEG